MKPNQINKLAKKAGITTAELLARAGISTVTFWRWQTGRSKPQMRLIDRIIQAAGGES